MPTKAQYADMMSEYQEITQDCSKEAAMRIRLEWLNIFEGLIRAAERGNVKAFLILREEAWGIPISGKIEATTTISLEELLSADEGGDHS
jgi:hypothetical protein